MEILRLKAVFAIMIMARNYKLLAECTETLNTYQFNENVQYVVPAGIAGIQKPGMARP